VLHLGHFRAVCIFFSTLAITLFVGAELVDLLLVDWFIGYWWNGYCLIGCLVIGGLVIG
jgi:hypothetical protein